MENTNSTKVKVINTTNGRLGVYVPTIPFRRDWLGKDASIPIEKETLEQLMYDPGFKYMIDTGMLYIEDMAVKKDLGIEPEDAEQPVNVIVLSDKERRYYMVNLSLKDFKEKVSALNREQLDLLVDYAIRNKIMDFDKSTFIKSICGRDIIHAIELHAQNKEN